MALEDLIQKTIAAIEEPGGDQPLSADVSPRERLYELLVLALGSLFPKSPLTGQMYDRATLLRIVEGMDDSDAAALTRRADDWIRLEGIMKQQEGQRAYYLPLKTLAALSVPTSAGLLGEIFDKILQRYLASAPSTNLRNCTRLLAAEFLISLAK